MSKFLMSFLLALGLFGNNLLYAPLANGQGLQSPESFLGYTLGQHFTPHYRMVDYLEHVAANSPRVSLETYGYTNERRPLVLAYITLPEDQANLEAIRTSNLQRAGLAEGSPSQEKAIVWLSYNVHGNEASAMEAAIATLYELADEGNVQSTQWLADAIVVLDPCINPDGRDRYANWYNQVANTAPNPNPEALEHNEPWPGGRPNHYLFDLNRDWAWQTQAESQARIAKYNQWLPHVHVDFHEQYYDDHYYFAPAAEPFHPYISNWQREFQTSIGKNHARYFDENGWLFFTREVFDLLYPSYGDTYPTFNGSIGMTYEQAGHSRAGLAVLTSDEDTLTLAQRVAHHTTTGISTVEATANNAAEVLKQFAEYYSSSTKSPQGKYKTYVVKAGNSPDKLGALTAHLDRLGIAYGKVPSGRSRLQGFNYATGTGNASFSIAENDIVLSAYQPKSVLLQVLFDPEAMTEQTDSLTYDITAWALPYAYGLEAYATTTQVSVEESKGWAYATASAASGNVVAYLAHWETVEDARFLAALHKQGIKVRIAQEAFSTNGQNYGPGSLIITRTANEALGEDLGKIVTETASAHKRMLGFAFTGFMDKGHDLGSSEVQYAKAPRVAVLAGDAVSSLSYGEVWHFMEQTLDYPLTVLSLDYVARADLSQYDVIIAPNGYYDDAITDLADWVAGGGRLVLIQNAMRNFAGGDFALERARGARPAADPKKQEDMSLRLKPYAGRQRRSISDYIPGAIYKVSVDNSHPLGFGYGSSYFSLKTNGARYNYLKGGWNVGVVQSTNDLTSGFVGYRLKSKMGETLTFGVEEHGSGSIVYMVDNPLFRAFWYNGKLFMANAIFMVN